MRARDVRSGSGPRMISFHASRSCAMVIQWVCIFTSCVRFFTPCAFRSASWAASLSESQLSGRSKGKFGQMSGSRLRAFLTVLPKVMRGQPMGRELGTQLVMSIRGSRSFSMRSFSDYC